MAADWYEHGGGHTTWTCRTCDQTVYGPPLNVHCSKLDGPGNGAHLDHAGLTAKRPARRRYQPSLSVPLSSLSATATRLAPGVPVIDTTAIVGRAATGGAPYASAATFSRRSAASRSGEPTGWTGTATSSIPSC